MRVAAKGRTPRPIWRWPVVLAILTVFGLLSALLGQGGLWWMFIVDRTSDSARCHCCLFFNGGKDLMPRPKQ
jgi:hypothetical protein